MEGEARVVTAKTIEELVTKLESLAGIEARTAAVHLLQSVIGFHRSALERMLEHLEQTDSTGHVVENLAKEPFVGAVLLLHGLHPIDPETRARNGLRAIEPYLRSGGYEVHELKLENGELNLQVRKYTAPIGSAVALKNLVENAIRNAAPDIDEITIQGFEEETALNRAGFVPIGKLMSGIAT